MKNFFFFASLLLALSFFACSPNEQYTNTTVAATQEVAMVITDSVTTDSKEGQVVLTPKGKKTVKITRYYTPIIRVGEENSKGNSREFRTISGKVLVVGITDSQEVAIKIEGFAKLIIGGVEYITDHHFVEQPYIKGSTGRHLWVGDCAVDRSLFPENTVIRFAGHNHRASDVGSAIKGLHIDLYEGFMPWKEYNSRKSKRTDEAVEVEVFETPPPKEVSKK